MQLLSQCDSTYNCLSRYVTEVQRHMAGTLSHQPTNQPPTTVPLPSQLAEGEGCFGQCRTLRDSFMSAYHPFLPPSLPPFTPPPPPNQNHTTITVLSLHASLKPDVSVAVPDFQNVCGQFPASFLVHRLVGLAVTALATTAADPEFDSLSLLRLVGPVVKASASRAEGPGFESRWRQDFSGVESYQ